MKTGFTFYEVPNHLHSDWLTDMLRQMSFVLHGFGRQRKDPAAMCRDRITGDFELIYVVDGESSIEVGQKTYACRAGDAVIIPPFCRHSILTPSDNPHDNYWIHFDVLPFYRQQEFLNALTAGGDHKIHTGLSAQLAALYEGMEEEIGECRPGMLAYTERSLVQIFTLLLRVVRERGENPVPSGKELPVETRIVDSGLAYIQDHIFETVRIGDICRHLHISESSLFKAFEKVLKTTPNHCIQLLKVKKAEQLIKSSSCSFKEIADKLSFSSPYYFSSTFKKFFGMSPRRYVYALEHENVQ